ncbi:hypothetical protein [Aurantiacibacter gilvus]|uniref:Lipoprotein n=1 Tax=Aurantiacibacter gilvus TaxID=3139141 RepID=A0ABU9IG84_9SPHN
MQFRHVLLVSLASAALASCGSSDDAETSDELAAPEPVLTSAPTPTAAPDGTALVPGSWTVNQSAEGGFAAFGEEGAEPALRIDCDRASGAVTLTLGRAASADEAWRIDAGGEAARIDMMPVAGGLTAQIEGSLAIFHAMSNAGEVVVLTSPTGERMQYPTHPGISQVLYTCS